MGPGVEAKGTVELLGAAVGAGDRGVSGGREGGDGPEGGAARVVEHVSVREKRYCLYRVVGHDKGDVDAHFGGVVR